MRTPIPLFDPFVAFVARWGASLHKKLLVGFLLILFLLLGTALLILGALVGYWVYDERGRVEALERDRLQVQARVIDEILGQGGMSAVYKAYDPNLKRVVAVKMIATDLERAASLADGLITLSVGAIPFAHLVQQRERLAGVVLVDDDTLREAVHFLWRGYRLAVEPSGAATTAAVRSRALTPVPPTVLVVSGGNVDPSLLED